MCGAGVRDGPFRAASVHVSPDFMMRSKILTPVARIQDDSPKRSWSNSKLILEGMPTPTLPMMMLLDLTLRSMRPVEEDHP